MFSLPIFHDNSLILSPPLPRRPITQEGGCTHPTSPAALLPIQTRWARKTAAAKAITQRGIPNGFNQPFNNAPARVLSLFYTDEQGQLGWIPQFQKSSVCSSMDCFHLFYMGLHSTYHEMPVVSPPPACSSACHGRMDRCSQFLVPPASEDHTSTAFVL